MRSEFPGRQGFPGVVHLPLRGKAARLKEIRVHKPKDKASKSKKKGKAAAKAKAGA